MRGVRTAFCLAQEVGAGLGRGALLFRRVSLPARWRTSGGGDVRTRIFERMIHLPVSAAQAFAWHARPGALERLTPPWERVELVSRAGSGLAVGTRVVLRARVGPVWREWEAEHTACESGRLFRDEARRGPFARWVHDHEFNDVAEGGCVLRDRVAYALPGGAAGRALAGRWVRDRLEAMFAWRQAVTRDDLARAEDLAVSTPLRVAVTGASGLLGRALVPYLRMLGHEVTRLTRQPARAADEAQWDPATGNIDGGSGWDAIVHLAGAGIADRRWTARRRAVLRDSRVEATGALARMLARSSHPPRVVVGGSATGFYGLGVGDAWVDEASPAGKGFLADLTRDWESAWAALQATGTRVVQLRTGIVLSPAGGALVKMLPAFRLGLGGPVGHGGQWWPWVDLNDVLDVIARALVDARLRGPVNAVAPAPVKSADFARELGVALGRPAALRAPAWALRAALGRGLANEALLGGQRVRPGVLLAAGHRFRHENLGEALRAMLGRVG